MSTELELARSFTDDVVERYARHFVEILCESLTQIAQPVRGLDLACGTGFCTLPVFAALPPGSSIVALSEDRFALKEFHRVLSPEDRTSIFPHKEKVERLPFADKSFDLVFACLPNQIWDKERPVLREAMRVLRPGGKLAIAAPLTGSFLELQSAIGASVAQEEHRAMQRIMAEMTHLVNAESWIKQIGRCGGSEITAEKRIFKLEVGAPPSEDHLVSRHVLPLWFGKSQSDETDAALDAAINEPLETTVRVGCIVAKGANAG